MIELLVVERFDASDIDYIVYNSLLESDSSVIIDLCNNIGTFIFLVVLGMFPCLEQDLMADSILMIALFLVLL